jgi:hypothetical protein
MSASGQVDTIVVQLARYLRANPLACDTQEGIAQWWLGVDGLIAGELETALERLESIGVVTRSHATDGQVRYHRAGLNAAVDAGLDRLIIEER